MRKSCTLILWMLSFTSAWAQTPQETSVKLYAPNGAQGTAFAVKKLDKTQLFATAAHVVAVDQKDISTYWGGSVFRLVDFKDVEIGKGYVSIIDAKNDLAIVVAPTNIPVIPLGEVEVTKMAPNWTPGRTPISIFGYASGKWLRTNGYFALATETTVLADCIGVPGQSGGPVLVDDKVVGVLSGGQAWYPYKTEDSKGNVTWPARCGSVEQLKQLINRAPK